MHITVPAPKRNWPANSTGLCQSNKYLSSLSTDMTTGGALCLGHHPGLPRLQKCATIACGNAFQEPRIDFTRSSGARARSYPSSWSLIGLWRHTSSSCSCDFMPPGMIAKSLWQAASFLNTVSDLTLIRVEKKHSTHTQVSALASPSNVYLASIHPFGCTRTSKSSGTVIPAAGVFFARLDSACALHCCYRSLLISRNPAVVA